MIIFGTAGHIQPHNVPFARRCSTCGNDTFTLHFVQRWFHLFWIPMFPIGKAGIIRCPACNNEFDEPALSEEERATIQAEKKNVRTPRYAFAGLYVIAIVAVLATYVSWMGDRHTAAYLAEPMRHDLYIIKGELDPEYPHMIFRLETIEEDSLGLTAANMGYIRESDAVNAAQKPGDKEFEFSTEEIRIARVSLETLFEKGTIEKVLRRE